MSDGHIYFSINVKMAGLCFFQSCWLKKLAIVIFPSPHPQDGSARSLEISIFQFECKPSEFNASWLVVLSFRGMSDRPDEWLKSTCKAKSVPHRVTKRRWPLSQFTTVTNVPSQHIIHGEQTNQVKPAGVCLITGVNFQTASHQVESHSFLFCAE